MYYGIFKKISAISFLNISGRQIGQKWSLKVISSGDNGLADSLRFFKGISVQKCFEIGLMFKKKDENNSCVV